MCYHGIMKYENMIPMGMAMALRNVSTVQERGQVTIPREIRERLGLTRGSQVSFLETEEGVLLVPRETVATAALQKIGDALREKGISLEDLLESGEGVREELIEETYGLTEK